MAWGGRIGEALSTYTLVGEIGLSAFRRLRFRLSRRVQPRLGILTLLRHSPGKLRAALTRDQFYDDSK